MKSSKEKDSGGDDDEFYDSESEPSFNDGLDSSPTPKTPPKNVAPPLVQTSSQSHVSLTFYAVQFSNEESAKKAEQNANSTRIFRAKENAMRLCKQDPENRTFRVFTSFNEAYEFSYGDVGSDSNRDEVAAACLNHSSSGVQIEIASSPQSSMSSASSRLSLAQDAEKLPFVAPKKPEVNEMRFFIEKNLIDKFTEKVLANPRFLISSGDSPIVYQLSAFAYQLLFFFHKLQDHKLTQIKEACRYNCLHVCAKENRPQICQLVLNLLSSVAYINKLYKNDSVEQAKDRSRRLLDLYLNTPEKGLNETPLHFAAKFGSYEVARLMLACEMCQKMPTNKQGQTPKDVICIKIASPSRELVDRMNSLFEECYYVPVYRDEDRGDVVVEKPIPKIVETHTDTFLSPSSSSFINDSFKSPLTPKRSSLTFLPSSSHKTLAAYVGPVSTTAAEKIYEKIKSPAGLRKSPANINILRGDDFKGYERILRELTKEMNVPFKEYWGFLDQYVNLRSAEGLEKVEMYLRQKKLWILLDAQIRSAQIFLNDRLNNNSSCAADLSELVTRLEDFIQVAQCMRDNKIELKENQLSHIFEQFVKATSDASCLPTDNSIFESLEEYMAAIIQLCRLDKSSRCYFSLYKTSKQVLDLLNCKNSFENFYLSPKFKQYSCQKTIIKPHPESTTITRTNTKIIYDSDEDDSVKSSSSDKEDESENDEDEEKMHDAEEDTTSTVENLNTSVTEELSKELNALSLKATRPRTLDVDTSSDEDEYVLNSVDTKQIGALKSKSSISTMTTDSQNCLFIFGDAPSKLDRAVYLAIQGVKPDMLNAYPLLMSWYAYMKSRQCDMQLWKTPARKIMQKQNH